MPPCPALGALSLESKELYPKAYENNVLSLPGPALSLNVYTHLPPCLANSQSKCLFTPGGAGCSHSFLSQGKWVKIISLHSTLPQMAPVAST